MNYNKESSTVVVSRRLFKLAGMQTGHAIIEADIASNHDGGCGGSLACVPFSSLNTRRHCHGVSPSPLAVRKAITSGKVYIKQLKNIQNTIIPMAVLRVLALARFAAVKY
jgi:hypothetical protein